MTTLWMDYETRSRVELKKAGVYPYVEDPDFSALMCAWSIDGKRVRLAIGEDQIMQQIGGAIQASNITKVAQNAQFERIVSSHLVGLPSGQYLDPEPWHDTAAIAVEKGWPRSLAPLAEALGGEQKDEAGTRLINLFCKPNRKGEWNDAESHPMEWLDFCAYCCQDVHTLISVDKKLGGWPTETERAVFMADQHMNDRGVNIDLWLAKEAVRCLGQNDLDMIAEIVELTEGTVANPNSQPQMMAWVKAEGLQIPNMQAETLASALEGELTDTQRKVLELKTELALTASKKFAAAVLGVCSDGRLRGQFNFFGAHTGRWSGRGVQLQNLPRKGFKRDVDTEGMDKVAVSAAKAAEERRAALEQDCAILDLKLGERVPPQTLKCLVRPLLVGPFTRFDYVSIEARVIAWLADEKWALKAFREGRDIYVETAERMSTPSKKLTRAHGKVAVLALGFAGGVNSLVNMGYDGTKDEGQLLVRQWRNANPKIVQFWSDFEDAIASGGKVGKYITVKHKRDRRGVTMIVTLPSGRSLNYHGLLWQRYRVEDPKTGKMVSKEGWAYLDPRKNGRIGTYGGRMTENVVQAVARDIMAVAMVALGVYGFPVVGTVHDEIIIDGAHDLKEVKRIMVAPPIWCPDLPIDAEGGHLERYEK